MNKIILLLFAAVLIISEKAIPLLDDDIGQQIFHESKNYKHRDKLYVIYVSNIPSDSVLAEFSKFCNTGRDCAILNGQNQKYQHLINFVGFNHPDYFLIFDVENRQKYCHPIHLSTNLEQITEFFDNFQKGVLEPYYTSEIIPDEQIQEHMIKIVGLTFKQFVDKKQTVRVLYLYTESELCDNCLKLYEEIAKCAKKYAVYPIKFGFLDLFKNQHKLLLEEQVPLILIYSKNTHNYSKINVDEIKLLEFMLEKQLGISQSEEL